MGTYVNSSTGSGLTGSLTGVTAGHRIFLGLRYIYANTTGPNGTVTDNQGNTWAAPATNSFTQFGTVYTEVQSTIAGSTGTLTFTATLPAGATGYEWTLLEFSGTSGAYDSGATSPNGNGGFGGTVNPVTFTPVASAVTIVACSFDSATEAAAGIWTLRSTNTNLWDFSANGVGGTLVTFNLSAGPSNSAIVLVAYKDAGAAAATLDDGSPPHWSRSAALMDPSHPHRQSYSSDDIASVTSVIEDPYRPVMLALPEAVMSWSAISTDEIAVLTIEDATAPTRAPTSQEVAASWSASTDDLIVIAWEDAAATVQPMPLTVPWQPWTAAEDAVEVLGVTDEVSPVQGRTDAILVIVAPNEEPLSVAGAPIAEDASTPPPNPTDLPQPWDTPQDDTLPRVTAIVDDDFAAPLSPPTPLPAQYLPGEDDAAFATLALTDDSLTPPPPDVAYGRPPASTQEDAMTPVVIDEPASAWVPFADPIPRWAWSNAAEDVPAQIVPLADDATAAWPTREEWRWTALHTEDVTFGPPTTIVEPESSAWPWPSPPQQQWLAVVTDEFFGSTPIAGPVRVCASDRSVVTISVAPEKGITGLAAHDLATVLIVAHDGPSNCCD